MATYYVDGAVGDDANAGTSEGAGNALLTIQAAMAKMAVADDRVYVKSSATYHEAVTTIYTPALGSYTVIEGYDTTPGDGGMVYIQNDAAYDTGIYCSKSYYIFRNFTCTDFVSYGLRGANYNQFFNCHAVAGTGGSQSGIYTSSYCQLENCSARGFTLNGIYVNQQCIMINCLSIDNAFSAYRSASYTSYINCVGFGGSWHIFYATANSVFINCVADGDSNASPDGFYSGAGYSPSVIMNCIAVDCVIGINRNNEAPSLELGGHNCLHGNTTDYRYWGVKSPIKDNDILADPVFTSPGSPDYDYSLADTSPCIGAAKPSLSGEERSDIGSYQTALPTGSGGGRVVITS